MELLSTVINIVKKNTKKKRPKTADLIKHYERGREEREKDINIIG